MTLGSVTGRSQRAALSRCLRLVWAAWVLIVVVLLAASVWPRARAAAPPADPPALAQLDHSLGLARGFVDGLYHQVGDRGVTSEYYALPVRVRFPGLGWTEPGTAHVTVLPVREQVSAERDETRITSGRWWYAVSTAVRWTTMPSRSAPGRRVPAAILSVRGNGHLPLGATVTVSVAGWTVGGFGDGLSSLRHRAFDLSVGRARFASLRYTIRHASEDAQELYRYLGARGRAAALGRFIADAGFTLDRDLYAPLWGRGERFGDQMPYSLSIYHDCVTSQPRLGFFYPYRSKVCTMPLRAYVFSSSYDTLVQALQALQVLQTHRDPATPYSDPGHGHLTPASVAHDLERKWTAFGEPECLVTCNGSWASAIRTAAFGALEAELGYRYGDAIARRFADAAAGVLELVQVNDSGAVEVANHRYYRPLQIGAFYSVWDRSFRNDQQLGLLTRAIDDRLLDPLNMKVEYQGLIPSNAESTLAAMAFLIRYRCLRYHVGCSDAPGQPGVS